MTCVRHYAATKQVLPSLPQLHPYLSVFTTIVLFYAPLPLPLPCLCLALALATPTVTAITTNTTSTTSTPHSESLLDNENSLSFTLHSSPFLSIMLSSALPSGCKVPSIKQPVKPVVSSRLSRPSLVARSTSLTSVPQLTAMGGPSRFKPTSFPLPAINIPSPPLTPHVLYSSGKNGGEDEDGGGMTGNKGDIFSSRFRWQQDVEERQEDSMSSLLKHSSSAPSEMSPLEMRALSSGVKTGFTFSSNLTPSQANNKEDHDSYECFVNKMEDDYWKSVSTIRTTYFFDGIGRGGGFLAIPHLASHGNAKTNMICRLLEAWLTEKLVEPTISDSIPVLEDNIQSSVQSIEQHLRQDLKVWTGISKSFIHIQCGHVFMLDTCCDDNTIVHLGADEFYQDYPLFVDVEIKMHCDGGQQAKESSTEVMIAFKNVVNRDKTKDKDRPYVHRAIFSEPRRRQSQDDSNPVA